MKIIIANDSDEVEEVLWTDVPSKQILVILEDKLATYFDTVEDYKEWLADRWDNVKSEINPHAKT